MKYLLNLGKIQDYKNCLLEDSQLFHKMTRFGQESHNIYTLETCKASLSSFNDKRWISRTDTEDWIYHSFGHKDISKLDNLDFVLECEFESEDEEETNYCF